MQQFYGLALSLVPQRCSAARVVWLRTGQQFFSHAAMSGLWEGGGGSCTLHHGSALGHLSVLGCSVLFSWAGAAPALLPVVFGDVVCQPVHFGFPALPQGFVKLHSEVLQCLLISFPKGQGVLEAGGTNQCTTEQVTAQPVRRLFIRNYSIERRNGVAINYF